MRGFLLEGGCSCDQRGFDGRSQGDIFLLPFQDYILDEQLVVSWMMIFIFSWIALIKPAFFREKKLSCVCVCGIIILFQGKDALLCLLTDKVDKAVIEEGDKLKVGNLSENTSTLYFLNFIMEY